MRTLLLIFVIILGSAAISCANSSHDTTESEMQSDSIGQDTSVLCIDSLLYDDKYEAYTDTIQVNGVSLAFEVKGEGKPVILLHGNSGSHNDLDSTMNILARAGYKVFGIDSRGQGANAPLTEYHYKDMAEDVHQFIGRKHLGHPAIYGWSDGGNVALQLEVMYPGTCAMIITSGANIFPDGWGGHKHIQGLIAKNPNPAPLRKMLLYEPEMTMEDMAGIQCPVLVCAGQHDIILESHTTDIAQNIPNGELMIVKNENHTSYVKHSKKVAQIVLEYLKAQRYDMATENPTIAETDTIK